MYAKRIAVVIALFSGPVMAQTVAQQVTHKAWQDQVDGQISFLNKSCGTSITGPIAYAGFDAVPDIASKMPVGQACGEAVQGVANLCSPSTPPAYKAAIQKGISKIVCTYGGTGKRAVSMSGGTVTYAVEFPWPGKVDIDGTHFVQYYVAKNL
jgi:hypothetical protein